ncbi:MAG: hypothetical protein ABIH23_15475 [bacterium]
MAKAKRVLVQLPGELWEWAVREAGAKGLSLSAYIRMTMTETKAEKERWDLKKEANHD